MLGELANDAAIERTDFVVQATEQLAKFLDRQPRARRRARRADADRRRPRLPLDRPRHDVPRPVPVRGPRHGRVDDRHRDRRDRERARGALQPGRDLRLVRRGRARGRRAGGRADRGRRPDGRRRHLARGDVRAGRAGRRRRVRRARPTRGPRASRRCSTPTTRRARRSRCTTSRSTSRSAASRARRSLIEQFEEAAAQVTGQLGDLIIVDDEDERLVLGGQRQVPGRGPARGLLRRVARARRRRRARRVLRPDRRVRRPGRRAGRGVPGHRAGHRGRGRRERRCRRGRRRLRGCRGPAGRGRGRVAERSRLTVDRDTRAVVARPATSHAHHGGGARRSTGDPPRDVAPLVARAVGRLGRARGPVRPPAHDRAGRAARPAAAADRHGGSGQRHADDPGAWRATVPRLGRRRCGWGTSSTCSGRWGGRSRWTPGRATCCWSPRARRSAALRLLVDEAIRDGAVRRPAVRGGRGVARSTRRACCPTRWSTSSRPRTGRWAIAGPCWTSSSTTRRGPTSRSRRVRRRCSARSPRWRSGVGGRLGVATLGRKRGGGRPVTPGSPEARRKAFLQVAPGQSIGCAAGTCLGCAVAGRRRRPAARLPRGAGVRRRRARLGGGPVKARRRVVPGVPLEAHADGADGPAGDPSPVADRAGAGRRRPSRASRRQHRRPRRAAGRARGRPRTRARAPDAGASPRPGRSGMASRSRTRSISRGSAGS